MLGKHPRCILNIARHFLKLQQREEMRRLRRKNGKPPSPGKQRFEDWLRDHGLDYQADRWRYRDTLETLPLEFRGAPSVVATPKREPFASFVAHKQAMCKAVPDAEPDRLNAYVALQMRAEGFSQAVVTDAIFHCASAEQPGQSDRNWRRYAERVTAYAFGIAGDMALARAATEKEKERQAQHQQMAEVRQHDAALEAPRLRMR